jgi:DNA-binding Lrp family transcriptional regulator
MTAQNESTPSAGGWWKLPVHVAKRTDLSPAAKLVYAAILDRIGDNHECWPGIRRLANDCGLSPTTVVEAARKLEAVGLLTVDHVTGNPGGRTNRYRFPERSDVRTYQNPNVPESEHRTYQNPNGDVPETGTEPDPLNQKREREKARRRFTAEQVEVIYQAYPKKRDRQDALKAISKALHEIAGRNGIADPVAWLLERVQAFAASPAGQRGQYTKYPATWFNKGSFDDDPNEWSRDRTANRPDGRIAAPPGKYDGI